MVNIILHCSDSEFGNAAEIEKWHLERGWSGIGYHYVILNGWISPGIYNRHFNGHIETGRPLDHDPFVTKKEIGAHVKGFNTDSVEVCLIGKSGQFSDEQLNSTLCCINLLSEQFGEVKILQHSDLDSEKPFCAGLNMTEIKNNYEIYLEIIGRTSNDDRKI